MMLNPHWVGGDDEDWTTGADWSTGAPPSSADDVVIDQGLPVIETDVGTVKSLTILDDGGLVIAGGGALTSAGDFFIEGVLSVDAITPPGQSGSAGAATLNVDGLLANDYYMQVGVSSQTASETITAENFINVGALALEGSATNAATLDVLGATNPTAALGVGAVPGSDEFNMLTGSVSLSGDALLEYGSGQFSGIYDDSELLISGTDAFVADYGDTDSDSALNLTSNQGTLALDNGASLTTGAGFINSYDVSVANTDDVATTTTLKVDNTTYGFTDSTGALDSSISVSGNSLLEFEQGGQITSIGQDGSLVLSGANARVADADDSSAISALTSNAEFLVLDDDASLTTGAGFVNTGEVSLSNDDGVGTTTLIVENTTAGFTDSTGALDSTISVSGDSLLEFAQGGQITSISAYGNLYLDGANAFIADADAPGSNSAIGALTSNEGQLYLDDGASLTTAVGFTNSGEVSIYNDDGATTTKLIVDNSTAGFTDPAGVLDEYVSVSGNSLLEFEQGGQITGIGAYGGLYLDDANAFVADDSSTSSNSALNLTSNAGALDLDDGASLTTGANFTNSGRIELDNDDNTGTTTLLVENTAASFENSSGALDEEIRISGDSLIEFAGNGQIADIGAYGRLSIDGADAFIADASAPSGNSAVDGLASNAGDLDLDDGATLATSATFVDTGNISIGVSSTTTAVSTLVAGSAASFTPSGTVDGNIDLGNNALLEFAEKGQITAIGDDGDISLDGTAAFIADAGALSSNSALAGLSNNAGQLTLDEGATIATSGALTNTGYIVLSSGSLDYSSPPSTSTAPPAISTLDIDSTAGLGTAGMITGTVTLGPDSLLEFAQGQQITGIGDDSELAIEAPSAFVADADDTTSNSALTGLDSLGDGSELYLADGASVTTSGGVDADDYSTIYLNGGASLTIGGALSDNGEIYLTAGAAAATTLDIDSTAAFGTAGTVTGYVSLDGNTLLEFAQGGEIETISGSLSIDGPTAFVADADHITSNSALTGLDDITGYLTLEAASVTTSGQLKNTGTIELASQANLIVTGTAAGFGDSSGALDGDVTIESG